MRFGQFDGGGGEPVASEVVAAAGDVDPDVVGLPCFVLEFVGGELAGKDSRSVAVGLGDRDDPSDVPGFEVHQVHRRLPILSPLEATRRSLLPGAGTSAGGLLRVQVAKWGM